MILSNKIWNRWPNFNVAYEFHGTTSAFNNQVGHVADQVSSEAKVEEHVENNEDHFDGVNCVEIAVADGAHGGHRPV